MDSLASLGGRLDAHAALLGTAADTLGGAADLAPAALGAEGPGRLGELGRALHARWVAAVEARAREAGRAATELTDLAIVVRSAARGYAESDQSAHRRLTGGR